MTVNLNCEPVVVGQVVLATAQLRIEVTDPEAIASHMLIAELYAALEPARKVVERIGIAQGISLSLQPYDEEDEDDDQSG